MKPFKFLDRYYQIIFSKRKELILVPLIVYRGACLTIALSVFTFKDCLVGTTLKCLYLNFFDYQWGQTFSEHGTFLSSASNSVECQNNNLLLWTYFKLLPIVGQLNLPRKSVHMDARSPLSRSFPFSLLTDSGPTLKWPWWPSPLENPIWIHSRYWASTM